MNKKQQKTRFWELFKKTKVASTEMIVSDVNIDSRTITVTSDQNCTQDLLSTIDSIRYQTQASLPCIQILAYTGTNPYYIQPYTLSKGDEVIEVTSEEYQFALDAAFDAIKKKRNYKQDFEELLK